MIYKYGVYAMDGRMEIKVNDLWEFKLVREGEEYSDDGFIWVDLPHDWLIYDCDNLYANGTGYYRKQFGVEKKPGKRYLINFDGVYMNSVIFVNGKEVGSNRYGYSSFEIDITDELKDLNTNKGLEGINEIMVVIHHESPNSRWYSGAGIYRDVTFKEVDETEKGYFEFGGSTVCLFVPKGSAVPDADIIKNTEEGFETLVKLGEHIGKKDPSLCSE